MSDFLSKKSRLARVFSVLLLLVAGVGQAWSQNVTIKSTNGSMIAAIKNGGTTDSFFGAGGFATWEHEQLSMVLTVSDNTTLTTNGQLGNPANNLFSSGDYIQIGKGKASGANTTYVSLSLPKGYRFTGYNITFSKSNETKGSGTGAIDFNSTVTGRFGETNSSFAYTNYADVTNNGGSRTISRTELNEGDMSNVLYFRLQNTGNDQNHRVLITLESAEFFFTAEEDYAPVLPVTSVSDVSAVDIPFTTSKVDHGRIQNRTYTINNRTYTRMSYASEDVKDLSANVVLYEAESTTDGTGIDGVSGKVVDYKNGTISSQGDYFKLGREGSEQVYFIESPTYVELSDANKTKNPIGYRIVGADIVYRTPSTETNYYITYTSGGTTYYLGTNGQFSTTKTEWETDSNGRIHSGSTYLGFTVSGTFTRTYTFRTYTGAPTNALYVDSNNRIYGTYRAFLISYTCYLYHNGTAAALSENTSNLASWTSETETPSGDGFTLYVYDKEGKNPVEYTNGNGTVKLEGLNNDAVKFGVKGIGLVRATLTLQALDPYLDQMSVVCQDEVQTEIRLNQYFTASDFSVSGGEFYFYLPDDCDGHQVAITFEELKSKYFDETYEGGSDNHTSRINFVKSDHYNAFGASNNNLYSDFNEAANAQEERLKVGIVGTEGFKFNNAADLATTPGVLTEYPFSLENYAAAPNNGSFRDMRFTVSEEDQALTRYVFTTDETRYNIAPTSAVQHRAYAFYEMIVHVLTKTYTPKVYFTKVYDKTLYGTGDTDAFYGVRVTALDGNNKPGYSSTDKIVDQIKKVITDQKDDADNTDIPADAKKVLYLDLSQLAGVYQMGAGSEQQMQEFFSKLADNCMIFMPVGSTSPYDNVAYKLNNVSSTFYAANNIVLTDKQPFYTPYDIQLAGANKVSYKRQVTLDKYGKVQNASLILPFIVAVDENGVHVNSDGTSFSLHTMQSNEALSHKEGEPTYAYFPALINVTTTTANTPYLVQLDENSSEDNISFVVEQSGSTISATTAMNSTNYTFTGESSTGVAVEEGDIQTAATYTFTPTGTYAGQTVNKSENIFYFASNQFVSSADLITSGTVKIAPFRAYYATNGTGGSVRLSTIEVIFGEGEGDTDAIRNLRANDLGMSIQAGRGMLTITAAEDSNIRIAGANGISRGNLSVKAGETKTVSVPAGIYVVNGVKIVVK